jgi:nucleotide-binding universal stress UspA family protein
MDPILYRSILVPLDGSTFGEKAIPLALSIARRAGAALQLAQVHIGLVAPYADTVLTYQNTLGGLDKEPERAYLDKLVQRLTSVADVPVTASLLEEGPIAEVLQGWATSTGVDLIVMTTHGFGPLVRSWLGSVADELVRRSTVPVLLVRPQEGKLDVTQEPPLRRILIPLDGSELAEKIIGPAVGLGRPRGAEYTLLRVVKPLVLGQYSVEPMPVAVVDQTLLARLQEMHKGEQAEASSYLERIAEPLRGRSLRVQTRVVIHEQPAVAILDEAKSCQADLIALETHGRSGLPRLFLGSVADKVVRGTSIPVLVQRPRQENT